MKKLIERILRKFGYRHERELFNPKEIKVEQYMPPTRIRVQKIVSIHEIENSIIPVSESRIMDEVVRELLKGVKPLVEIQVENRFDELRFTAELFVYEKKK